MNIPEFSTNGLRALHQAILDALVKDDNTPSGEEKPYGAREFPDWRKMSDELEAELSKRNVAFQRIPW